MLGAVVQFKFPTAIPLVDWEVRLDLNGTRIVLWNAAKLGPQPTEETLAAWQTDPAFVAWQAERGGDAALTARRKARELLQSSLEPDSMADRVLAEATRDEINLLRQWIMAFKAASAASITLADLKVRVAALPNMPDRTKAQLRTVAENKLTAGEVDS